MKKLDTKAAKRWYFIKDSVIFDIKASNQGDSCAVQGTDGTIPSIKVTKNSGETLFYLDSLVKDGDKCDTASTPYVFTKTIHGASPEESVTLSEYYRTLVIQGIKLIVKVNFKKDYDEIKKLLVGNGIPAWCLSGEGYSAEGFDQVDFTEEFFNQIKNEIVWEEATEAAKKVAAGYGYEVSDGLYDAISGNITPA